MNENITKRNDLLSQKVIKGLESRNMKGFYAKDREEALKIALDLIPEGSSVTMGGSVSADILCRQARPQMATVQENALPAARPRPVRDGTVSRETCSAAPAIRILSSLPRENRGASLRGARVILSGGKGVGSREGFEKLRQLAKQIPGAVVGASRGAVSANLAPYECQVGLTGEFVRPPIYIAFGISGAVQHLVGMRNSGTIIAVNTDKNAPIFDYSDVAVVAPWESVAEELLLALKNNDSLQ